MEYTSTDPIEDVLPRDGLLGEYVRFTSGLEACARFRFFAISTMLGAVINNKIWVQRGEPGLLDPLFPNPWVLLLAPPGRGHKTSTINMASNLMMQACPDVRILADKLTPESLVKALAAPASQGDVLRIGPSDATGLIKASEFSVFFGKQQYNQGLVTLITDLYDYRKEWSSETIMRGKFILKNNCLSIIGGSTPRWLQTMIPEDAFTGGFMSRFILVEMPGNYNRRVASPQNTSGVTWEELVSKLNTFYSMKFEMGWEPGAYAYYEDYYEAIRPHEDDQMNAYLERRTEHTIRLAMQLALCEEKDKIHKSHINKAIQILDFLLPETEARISKITTNPRAEFIEKVRELLHVIGPMTKGQLMKKTMRMLQGGEGQFNETLRMLQIAGQVEVCGGTPQNPKYKLRSNMKIKT